MLGNNLPLLLVVLLLASIAPDLSETSTTRDPDSAIDEAYRLFSEAWANDDAEAAAATWTEDAMFIPPEPDTDIIRGRDAIEAMYASIFAERREAGVSSTISFRIVDRTIQGDLAADVGYARIIQEMEDGEIVASTMKVAIVLKQVRDGEWQTYVDTFSGTAPEAFDNARSARHIGD